MQAKLLVVDDEPDLELLIRQKFRRQIRDDELRFVFARNGIEALQTLAEEPDIDLVLTDINMPEMDGLTLLLKLQELNRALKAVIVSAYGDMDNIRTAMNRGAADFLTKPIDFQDLEITINKTLQQMQELKEAVREHDQLLAIRRELDIASQIQQSMLPRTFPPFPQHNDFQIFAEMIPAREVGGDFYDFFLLDENRLGFVIGDVSGKGVPAAIFMAISRTLLRSTALTDALPGPCLERVNSLLCVENSSEMFVSLFYGVLHTHTGEVKYCNGGHNPPYILRANGSVEPVAPTDNMVLGAIDSAGYGTKTVTVAHGDTIVLYTDGITEAMDTATNLYSDARLQHVLTSITEAAPEAIVRRLVDDVQRYCSNAPQSDDITVLAIKRT